MKATYIKTQLKTIINVSKIVTIHYYEFDKTFDFKGEKHDFWEMVYIDKGEMICTADKRELVLKDGELIFHKPNEFHNLSGNRNTAPNVSIITFECKSRAMRYFDGKIFRLNAEEKALLSMLFKEGLSAYSLVDKKNPLLQRLERLPDAPFGASQMTKNLLEIFLIRLHRHEDALPRKSRYNYKVGGVDIPHDVKEILDYIEANVYGKISIADIAGAVGKSASTVKNLFSTYRSGGIVNYYNELKIEEAKRLIREGKYNFTQISELLSFDTPQYFSASFRRIAHMSPLQYKKSIL